MFGHMFLDTDLTRTLQAAVDKALKEFPTESAPKGFTWQPLVKQVPDPNNKYTYILEWVAKPNGK